VVLVFESFWIATDNLYWNLITFPLCDGGKLDGNIISYKNDLVSPTFSSRSQNKIVGGVLNTGYNGSN
jgi:hypothetical protein